MKRSLAAAALLALTACSATPPPPPPAPTTTAAAPDAALCREFVSLLTRTQQAIDADPNKSAANKVALMAAAQQAVAELAQRMALTADDTDLRAAGRDTAAAETPTSVMRAISMACRPILHPPTTS